MFFLLAETLFAIPTTRKKEKMLTSEVMNQVISLSLGVQEHRLDLMLQGVLSISMTTPNLATCIVI